LNFVLNRPENGALEPDLDQDTRVKTQKVGPIWGSSIYVKYGDAWKWAFGINVPARGEGT